MYLYLASPYSAPDPEIRETRYQLAEHATAILLRVGVAVYSPIVHCHTLAKNHDLPGDFAFWEKYNYRMLSAARKLLVLKLPGWSESIGVRAEIQYAHTHYKEILYYDYEMMKLWKFDAADFT